MAILIFFCLIFASSWIFWIKMGKRKRRWIKLKIGSTLNTEKKPRYPEKMSESEKVACSIFMKLMLEPTSKLYYDIQTAECFVSDIEKTIFIFLESGNMKIINTVYGYDTFIQRQTEIYLSYRFKRELTKRRGQFKAEAMQKVEHSLHNTLEKLNSRK